MVAISRRDFIKIGTIAGIGISLGRLPLARAVETGSGTQSAGWVAANGKARYRWDAIRKVSGQKVFARDFLARDLPGWPRQQAHAFFIKAGRVDKTFEKNRFVRPAGRTASRQACLSQGHDSRWHTGARAG